MPADAAAATILAPAALPPVLAEAAVPPLCTAALLAPVAPPIQYPAPPPVLALRVHHFHDRRAGPTQRRALIELP